MKLTIKWSILVGLSLVLAACGSADSPNNNGDDSDEIVEVENNIVDVARREGFTEFVQALERASLDDDFGTEVEYTLFVPTNEAFNAADSGSLESDNFLEYHVVPGAYTLEDLSSGPLETENGLDLEVSVDGGNVTLNGDVNVTMPNNLEAANGVVHAVDSVLTPPDEPDEDEDDVPEEPETSFTADLTVLSDNVESTATGTAFATLEEGNVLSVEGDVQDLTSEITRVALYEGGGDDTSVLLYDLEVEGTSFSGSQPFTRDDLQILDDGDLYVGISTQAYPFPAVEVSGPFFSEE